MRFNGQKKTKKSDVGAAETKGKAQKGELKLPKHIAFIMDGNGRWASGRMLPRKAGHREGVKAMRRVADDCFSRGIGVVTFYAFSTENRNRPQDEVEALFGLMREYFSQLAEDLSKNNIRFCYIGDLSYLPSDLVEMIQNVSHETAGHTRGIMNLALDYGSRDEIVRAVNRAVAAGKPVDESEFSRLLDTGGLPDPDMIVRTGGEVRLSNFLLYQAAYSELFFTDTLWPAFDKKDLTQLLEAYSARDRRFGKIR